MMPDRCCGATEAARLPVQYAETHPEESMIREELERELAEATAELKAHMATWEYAFAMGASRSGGSSHPLHWETQARTERLSARCRDLRARLAEHDL
jgi:hypothetical protein